MLGRLLFFTDPRVLAVLLVGALLVAMYRRRWRLAAVVAVTPVVAVVAARLVKRVFGRESDGALAYPSGHTTLAVAVLGMVVLVAGAAAWAVAIAVAWSGARRCSGRPSPTTTSPTPSARCCWPPRCSAWPPGPPNLTGVNPAAM